MIDIKRAVENVSTMLHGKKLNTALSDSAKRFQEIRVDPQERLEWQLIGIIAEHENSEAHWRGSLEYARCFYDDKNLLFDHTLSDKLTKAMRDAVGKVDQEYLDRENIELACEMANRLIKNHVDHGWDAVLSYAERWQKTPGTEIETLAGHLMVLIAVHEFNYDWECDLSFALKDIYQDPGHWIGNIEEDDDTLMHKIGFTLAKAAGIRDDVKVEKHDIFVGDIDKPLFLPTQGYHPEWDDAPDIKADADRVAEFMSRIPDDPAPAQAHDWFLLRDDSA